MNILIENAETLEYFTDEGLWTKKVADGKCFGNTRTAYAAAKAEIVPAFNIVSYIPATQQFVNLSHGKGKSPVAPATAA